MRELFRRGREWPRDALAADDDADVDTDLMSVLQDEPPDLLDAGERPAPTKPRPVAPPRPPLPPWSAASRRAAPGKLGVPAKATDSPKPGAVDAPAATEPANKVATQPTNQTSAPTPTKKPAPQPPVNAEPAKDRTRWASMVRSARLPTADGWERRRYGSSTVLRLAAAVVVIALAVAAVAYATTRSSGSPAATGPGTHTGGAGSTSPAPGTAATANRSTALAWMKANLDAGSHVGADSRTAAALAGTGFTAVRAISGSASQAASAERTLDWLVSSPATRAMPNLAALEKESVPVARFGTGSDSFEVSSVVASSPGAVLALVRADRGNRALAGAGLAANPHLTGSSSFRTALRSGSLDLRAATFLAVLASSGSVRVVTAVENPAERAVGTPIRALSVDAGSTDVRAALQSMPTAYQPMSVIIRGSQTALVWSPAVSPVKPIS